MSRPRLLVPALVIALLPACQQKPEEAGSVEQKSAPQVEPGKAQQNQPASDEAGQPAPVDTAPPAEGGADEEADDETGEPEPAAPLPEEFEKVGVEACDEYVTTYVACIGTKVPESEREAQRRIVFDNITAWKQTAAGGGAAEKALQIGCKSAAQQAKRATEEWGCEW